MAAFPLYSPLICPPGWEPDFTAGATQCTLQSGNVTRSRITAGGTFFRSVETAGSATVNNIVLSCTITLTGTVGDIDTYDVIFNYTDPLGVSQTPITVEQKIDTGAPGGVTLSGIDELRTALSGNSIVTMPLNDTPEPWVAATDDADFLSAFGGSPEVNMTGGVGLPIYSSGIRTGPTYALFHIDNADTAENGDNVTVNEISEWDGINNQWISHPSTSYEIDSVGNITPTPPCP